MPRRCACGQARLASAVAARFGDPSYLSLLEFHAGGRIRGRVVRLPSLDQILREERAFALAPAAMARVLRAQEQLRLGVRGNWPTCSAERRWRPEERRLLEGAAREVEEASALLRKLTAPRSLLTNLAALRTDLVALPSARGGPLCKGILAAHRRTVHALRAAVLWARSVSHGARAGQGGSP